MSPWYWLLYKYPHIIGSLHLVPDKNTKIHPRRKGKRSAEEDMASMDGVRSLMILLILGAAFSALNSVIAELDWRTCGNSLPKACGVAIGQRVNLKKGPVDPLADDCCVALVKIGKDCHDAFTRVRDCRYKLPLSLQRKLNLYKRRLSAFFYAGTHSEPQVWGTHISGD